MLIKRPTTLILGAGASVPYDFPLGSKLRDLILTRDDPVFDAYLASTQHPTDHWSSVQKKITAFRPDSIDEYLAKWSEHADVVKMAIAYRLSRSESIDTLLSHSNPDHWYDYLLKEVLGNDPNLGGGMLRVVTFNYDLSLEMYLHTVLQSRFRLDEKQTRHAIDQLGIVHVHGHIGPIRDLHDSGRSYGPIGAAKQLVSVCKTISTCFESEAKGDMERARKSIGESEAIIFLGFGYSAENLAHLQFKQSLSGTSRVLGSTYKCAGWQARLKPLLHRPDEFTEVRSPSNSTAVTTGILAELIAFANDDSRFSR